MVPKEFGTGTREFPFLGWYQKNFIPKYRYRHTLCTTGSNLWWVFLNGTYWYKEKDLFQHIWICYRAIALLYTSEYLHIDLNGNSKFPDLSSTHLILTLPRFVKCKEGCQVIRVRFMPSSVALQAMTLEPWERNFCSPGGDPSAERGDVPVVEMKCYIRNYHDRTSQKLWLKLHPSGHALFANSVTYSEYIQAHCTLYNCNVCQKPNPQKFNYFLDLYFHNFAWIL